MVSGFGVKIAAALVAGLAVGAPAFADEFTLEGIYGGSIALDGGGSDIPLQVSLALTGEQGVGPDGNPMQVIDGAFLIDGEGGAYAFSQVTFDIRDAKLDLRYDRAQISSSPTPPSSFRLIGRFNAAGVLSGRVLSGSRGPIGNFSVQHIDSATLVRSERYAGRWRGNADLIGGGRAALDISLIPTPGSTTNPDAFEFDYTPGKLGRLVWNGMNVTGDSVIVDYLRNAVTLRKYGTAGTTTGLAVEFAIDRKTREAVGTISSSYRGVIGTFRLPAYSRSPDGPVVGGGTAPEPTEPASSGNGADVSCDPFNEAEARVIFNKNGVDTGKLEFSVADAGAAAYHAIEVKASGSGCYSIPAAAAYEEGGVWHDLPLAGTDRFALHYFQNLFVPRHLRLDFEALFPSTGACNVRVRAVRFSQTPSGLPYDPTFPTRC